MPGTDSSAAKPDFETTQATRDVARAQASLDLVRERRNVLEAAGSTPTQAYVIALEERLLDEHDENQRLWDQQPEATVTSLGEEQRLAEGDRDGSAAPTGERLAQTLYESAVRYLLANSWRREDDGSGWWWREGMNDALLGEALDQQLEADGFDRRAMLPDEPQEFWG